MKNKKGGDSVKSKLYLLTTALSLGIANVALAAYDEDIVATATSTATVIKENIIEAVSSSLPIVVLAGVLILAIGVVWKLGKRFVSGR